MLCLHRCFTQTAKIIKCDDGLHHICSKDKVNLLNKLAIVVCICRMPY